MRHAPPAPRPSLSRRPVLAALLVLALVGVAPRLAVAHHLAPGAGGGIPIPSLAHGQMQVYARHWDAIVRLAALNPAPTAAFSRVFNFARIQKAMCLWGLAPAAIADEDSPFNACSHAYLAAGRALLEELRETAPSASPSTQLGALVDRELALEATPELCAFSDTPFNTADHVVPQWGALVRHPPTLSLLALVASLLCASAAALRRRPLRTGHRA